MASMGIRWWSGCAVMGLFTCASAAQAEDVGSILEVLEETVVTGVSRSAERASDAPATSTTITAEQLRRYGLRNLGDALNFLSLGMFSHDRMSTPEVGARGVAVSRDSNSHVLVVLDGMVVNEQGGGAVFLHDVPIDLVDHIEVILGPGSVLYGAQAMLGVINVVTVSPENHPGFRTVSTLGASAPMDERGDLASPETPSALGHDHRHSFELSRGFQVLGQQGYALAAFDYSSFKGPYFAFKKQEAPGLDFGPHAEPGYWGGPVRQQWSNRTAGVYTKAQLGDLSFSTRATTTKLSMPQIDLFESRAPAAYDDARNENAYQLVLSNLRYEKRFAEKVSGMGRLYFGYSRRHNSRFVIGHDERIVGVPLGVVDPQQCPMGPLGPCTIESFYLSRWIGLEGQSTYDWFGDGAYSTMVGVDGRLRTAAYEFVAFDDLTGLSYGSNPGLTRWHAGGNDSADEVALGAYLQQTARPWPELGLNAGVRADFDTRLGSAISAEAVSPRAAILANPHENVALKFIYSKAFRAPSFIEQKIVNGRLLPNPRGLSPETVSSFEASASLRVTGYRLTLGGFYAEWKNLIELVILNAQAPSVSRFENVSDVTNYGGSLSLEGAFVDGKLRVGLNSMLTAAERALSDVQRERNEDLGDSVPMTVAPKLYGNARAQYTFSPGATLGVAAGYLGRRIADQAFYAGDPSNLAPRPEAPPQLALRAALTGDVPSFRGVGYVIGGKYSFASREPFVVGPNQGLPRYLDDDLRPAELSFVNRFSVFAGLEFALEPEPEAVETAEGDPLGLTGGGP